MAEHAYNALPYYNRVFRKPLPPPPSRSGSVTGLQPDHGPEAGGTWALITGTGLAGAQSARFGDDDVAGYFRVADDSHVICRAPAGAGVVAVEVWLPDGTAVLADAFTYDAP